MLFVNERCMLVVFSEGVFIFIELCLIEGLYYLLEIYIDKIEECKYDMINYY